MVAQCNQSLNTNSTPVLMKQLAYHTQPAITLLANQNFIYDPSQFTDIGATYHIMTDLLNLAVKIEFTSNKQLQVGNEVGLKFPNIGMSSISSAYNPNKKFILSNMLHIPSTTKNLLSMAKFTKDKCFHGISC